MPVRLPSQIPSGSVVEIEPPFRLVVIGANGSGKTRFGIWLEEQNQKSMRVQRISAQKALSIPDFAPVKNLEQAEMELHLGRSDQHASLDRKFIDRWGSNPATFLLSDYEKLLAVLFARDADRNRRHTELTRQSGEFVPVADSPIDQIIAIWGHLMPHREIALTDGKVLVGKGSQAEYHGKEMSDGERVALYLLGQCLTAPNEAMIIIDEPELHLHRSLMDKLWNKVEELCPDKTFVYITHDLDFAASRIGARKVWVQSYSAGSWNWTDVPSDEDLPEPLILEIIGNRKPLLLCEGEHGGLDHVVYQMCFPNLHVVPRGGCDKVVETVKALKANKAFNAVSAIGMVDRDVKSDTEIAALVDQGVHVLRFAEIENLLCARSMVSAVAKKMGLDEASVVTRVTEFVITSLTDELDTQVAMRAARRIRYQLSCYSPVGSGVGGLQEGLEVLLGGLDMAAVVAEARAVFASAIDSSSLDEVLKVYNRKTLVDRISHCFGLAQGEYQAMVIRLLRGADAELYISHLKCHLPDM